MAKRKKATAGKRTTPKRKQAKKRLFSFSLPVHFTLQYTFSESEILNPDDDEPDISEAAIAELEQELAELIGENYAIGEVYVLDDSLNSIFLNESIESPRSSKKS